MVLRQTFVNSDVNWVRAGLGVRSCLLLSCRVLRSLVRYLPWVGGVYQFGL